MLNTSATNASSANWLRVRGIGFRARGCEVHEWDEVAEAMLPNFLRWLGEHGKLRTHVAASEYVREQMPDEGMVLRDNVAGSLYRISGRINLD
jgi:hypothetical protein